MTTLTALASVVPPSSPDWPNHLFVIDVVVTIFRILDAPKIPSESQVRAGDVADNGAPAANASAQAGYAVHYDEGSEVAYKWHEAQNKKPLFPFGCGLFYTTYAYSGLSVDSTAKTARFTVKNTGKRTGTEIAQVYGRLPKGSDESFKRLVGWKRITLAPGESQTVTVCDRW
jgi:beta-glucosidase